MERIKSKRNVNNTSGKQKNNSTESVDRISALPNPILGVILSLLPTKNALATSTLSKRWEFLWRTVHNLDFCLEVQGRRRTVEQVEDENEKFVGFVNHVLLHHDAGVLNKFRLEWKPTFIESNVTSWIKTAITRNVHELSLALDECSNGGSDMPISLFSCDSLRSLQLTGHICLSAATVFWFPRLESLELYGVTFKSDEAFKNIIRGCPVLNYLHIDMDGDTDEFVFVISSTSLRHLELNLGRYKYLKLDASSLEHLMLFADNMSVNFVQKSLSSLVEAGFGINLYYDDISQAAICSSVVDAVSALDCAKILSLSDDVMRALNCATIKLSTAFKRLVELETCTSCCHWSSLQGFIQTSNNLEVLKIHKNLDDENDHDHSNWTTPVEVPRCLSTSLKKVVLDGYYGHEDEREMLHYMLKHGSALEIMKISCGRHVLETKKFELLQEICEVPRKSPACKVKFKGWI